MRRGIHTLEDLRLRCFEDEDTGCWTWRGALNGQGAPSMRVPALGRAGSIGELLSVLAGPLPAGRSWVPLCGNWLCCRPDRKHRASGTRSMQSRMAQPYRTTEQKAAIARSRNAGSRLSAAAIELIRGGTMTDKEAARVYGITPSYAWAIRVGRKRAYCATPAPGASVFTWRPGT